MSLELLDFSKCVASSLVWDSGSPTVAPVGSGMGLFRKENQLSGTVFPIDDFHLSPQRVRQHTFR